MNWDDTKQNFRTNLSVDHLKKYPPERIDYIIHTTVFIYAKAVLIASYKWLLRQKTPINRYESEASIFRAWVCYIVATEILKR